MSGSAEENGDKTEIAALAHGDNVDLSIRDGLTVVIGGDQIHGNQYNVEENEGNDPRATINRRGSSRSSTLAGGEHVEQKFTDTNITVVEGDQIGGDKYEISVSITNHSNKEKKKSRYTSETQPNGLTEWATGSNLSSFIHKVNSATWENVKAKVMENFQDLSEPDKEFYPRLKTGFEIFKGDYLPQDGFSAHCNPKSGRNLDFEEFIDDIQKDRNKPNIVIGQPGSGKTIMMRRLAKRLILSNQLNEDRNAPIWRRFFRAPKRNYDAVLHINIRDIRNEDYVSLSEAIFCHPVSSLTLKEAEYGLKAIIERKIRVIMFLDGLDQACWDPVYRSKITPWEKSSTGNIFGNILSGHLLSHVPITISSREHSVALLPVQMRPELVTALVGFSRSDAKALYCEIMGENSVSEWEKMRIANPAMHYMCLTPLFLAFYMIAKKKYPDDPPDCASGVMIRIIQILLESDSSRTTADVQEISAVINNLKRMAFQGTKEQRVVFTNDDLETFQLNYKDISDIIIKVPGLTLLGQKILGGMYKFFFSHQTLQEVFSALYAVELCYSDFERLVDDELCKPSWSVVRHFVSGILKNESLKNRISQLVLRQSQTGEKFEHLMTVMKSQLCSSSNSAAKLDVCIALKEADALDVLPNLIQSLDLSNSPLTPAMMDILCSVLRYFEKIPHLSISNAGVDRDLLQVLSSSSKGLGLQIGKFDVRGNVVWTFGDLWKEIFERIEIDTCLMDITPDEQGDINAYWLLTVVDAASQKVNSLELGVLTKIKLGIDHIRTLNESCAVMQIDELHIQPNADSFNFAHWKQTFSELPFTVERCIIESPTVEETSSLVDVWIQTAKAIKVGNVKSITLHSTNEVLLSTADMASLNQSGFTVQVDQLVVRPVRSSFDGNAWRRVFQDKTVNIKQCRIQPPLSADGTIDASTWIAAAKAMNFNDATQVMLESSQLVCLHIDDIKTINKLKLSGKISKLVITPYSQSFDRQIWVNTFQETLLSVDECLVAPPRSTKGYIDARIWIDAADAIRTDMVNQVSLTSSKNFPLGINDLMTLNGLKFQGKMDELYVRPSALAFDATMFGRTLQAMQFTVNHCFILRTRKDKTTIDFDVWMDATETARGVSNVQKVCLAETSDITLTSKDVKRLNETRFTCEIESVRLVEDRRLTSEEWKRFGETCRKFNVSELQFQQFSSLLNLPFWTEGHKNIKVRQLKISWLDEIVLHFTEINDENGSQKVLDAHLPRNQLDNRPHDVGRFIRKCNVEEVLFGLRTYGKLDVAALAAGLKTFKINRVATSSLYGRKLLQIVENCKVERLFLYKDLNQESIAALQLHTVLEILSRDEWEQLFL